tara:strand:- start:1696 stop:2724 length:1029 start_codon:yes stop_codon:yes gene_type:complete
MDYKISNISVKSGSRLNERLTYAIRPDGEPLTIPLAIVNGKKSGPVLCLNTGTHGDEPEGTIAILDILEEIEPSSLSGVLVGIPALNVTAFTSKVSVDVSGIRENPLDWKNLARIFPGNPQGTVTDRLADTVVKEILPKVDYVLDFHSGGSRGTSHFISGFVGVDNELGAKSMELAKMFPIETLWRISPWAKFASTCIDNNTPISIIETTGQGRADKRDVDVLKIGIRNIMIKLKMIDGKISNLPKKRELIDSETYIYAKVGGILRPNVTTGDKVKKGEKIGNVINVFGEVNEKVVAPHDGIVTGVRTKPVAWAGEPLYLIGKMMNINDAFKPRDKDYVTPP